MALFGVNLPLAYVGQEAVVRFSIDLCVDFVNTSQHSIDCIK